MDRHIPVTPALGWQAGESVQDHPQLDSELQTSIVYMKPFLQKELMNTDKEKEDQFKKKHTASMDQASSRPGPAHVSATRASWDSCLGSVALRLSQGHSGHLSVQPCGTWCSCISLDHSPHSPSLLLLTLKSHHFTDRPSLVGTCAIGRHEIGGHARLTSADQRGAAPPWPSTCTAFILQSRWERLMAALAFGLLPSLATPWG